MVARIFVAALLATAALGCRDDGKQIVIVHFMQMRADALNSFGTGGSQAAQAEAFAREVVRAVAANPDCGAILIARDVQARDGDPLQDLLRRPHWDLTIAYSDEDDRQSWMLAGDGYKVLREGIGSAQDIGGAVCLQGREADGDGREIVSAH
ncbi:MAG TPA: hypothetical protein VGM96_23060 [Reyranella sp.]|jgi:hypothetical protein